MAAELEEFKEILKREAECLIKNVIPEKIVALNRLIDNSIRNQDLANVHQDVNIPIPSTPSLEKAKSFNRGGSRRNKASSSRAAVQRARENPSARLDLALREAIPCNKCLTDLIFLVKPHVKQLLEDTNVLKMWVNFMIPKFEDGNNFGVAIQEVVLNKIDLVEKFAYLLFNYTSLCFMSRAEIVSKVATFPHINDYRRAVKECDENNYRYLCKMLCQIRDFYCALHDIVSKNMDRIKNPRVCEINSMCI
ncbi:proteasome activator complex subunit 3-like [Pectinophora gossypiella]|uniref:proteasome activator complex subunit 3-like n=1 Tax=Pectinophora gossypiella TaxID=13191 RepID=UPI00214EFC98|nr:proteasome activator complex subunit 3-like [Pectinophora gossypiella]